ncbi:thioesterase II family protein [Streptomyces sp. NRRL F-525]|uniref:thioesterase II family protein n=1 Tax=Streptomyces sp. NRRL F-525 TaxID=1463861 RepID=UPI0005240E8C|nr:thioesterase II family protein [Streptomyces sp. NRRL F-525]
MATPTRDRELWIQRFPAEGRSGTRLVCFPHAGGSASFYFPLSQALAADTEVLAVQYPGRQDRRKEVPVEDIQLLADHIADALDGRPELPTAYFGHSMGAVVAFEVARRLERRGNGPALLFASGRRAPSTHREESVHQRDDDGVIDELKRLNGTDARVLADDELLRMILPAIRGDYRAIETYRCPPGPKLGCPVTVLVGDADPRTTLDEAHAWSTHTTGRFDLRVFPGGHFYLSTHPEAVTETVAAGLATLV